MIQPRHTNSRILHAEPTGLTHVKGTAFSGPHLHFHCVVIDGALDTAPVGGATFHEASGRDVNGIARVQCCVSLARDGARQLWR